MTPWDRLERAAPLITAACVGFSSSIGQILILRELLVLFYGNELSTGLFFACWLMWTALGAGTVGLWLKAKVPPAAAASALLIVGAVALPATLLFLRAARPLWSVAPGEMLSLSLMTLICILSTLTLCVALGALFSLAWSCYTARSNEPCDYHPVRIYLCEALGAAGGGLLFTFLLMPHVQALIVSIMVSGVLLAAAGLLLYSASIPPTRKKGLLGVWWVAVAALLAVSLNVEVLDASSRRWQWGEKLLADRDTPYHNLALLEDAGLYSLFGNGLWYFSVPDPQSAELSTHLALLQHAEPRRVLLVGGGVSGLIEELFKEPAVMAVDYIEPDPELISFAESYLPGSLGMTLADPRLRVVHEDASFFLRRPVGLFDVILSNVGEPMNLELNRYYTLEFFRKVRARLSPGGVFSFALPVAPDMVGPTQIRLLKSLFVTAKTVFEDVRLVLGGEGARFLASNRPYGLVGDPEELIRRVHDRGLTLSYLNDIALRDLFGPFRQQYVSSMLKEGDSVPLNRDFKPDCALQSVLVWSAQLHPALQEVLVAMASRGQVRLWSGITGLLVLLAIAVRGGRSRWGRWPAIGLCVALVGGAQMVLELNLLLGFQVLEGFVYKELALIVSGFMVGIALGAALFERYASKTTQPVKLLGWVQAGVMGHLAGTVAALYLLHWDRWERLSAVSEALFPLLALLGGALGGLHFSLAVRSLAADDRHPPGSRLGGGLYALDLVGAAGGATVGSLILLPVYGLVTTTVVALALVGGSLALLFPMRQM